MMANEVKEFPQEVAGKLGYYVYRLVDPRNGETFYVGKGQGNRIFDHIKGKLLEKEFDNLSAKMQIIHGIHNAGLEVIHIIHLHKLTETEADKVEAALIDAYYGLSNLQKGMGSRDYGPMNSQEIINLYAAPEAVIIHKVILITINRTASELEYYNATRAAWKLKIERAQRTEYVLAVERGLIVDVFQPTEWKIAMLSDFPDIGEDRLDRIGFIGVRTDDSILAQYVNKQVPEKYRKRGAANPVKYSY